MLMKASDEKWKEVIGPKEANDITGRLAGEVHGKGTQRWVERLWSRMEGVSCRRVRIFCSGRCCDEEFSGRAGVPFNGQSPTTTDHVTFDQSATFAFRKRRVDNVLHRDGHRNIPLVLDFQLISTDALKGKHRNQIDFIIECREVLPSSHPCGSSCRPHAGGGVLGVSQVTSRRR
jgi:hypothetical protein